MTNEQILEGNKLICAFMGMREHSIYKELYFNILNVHKYDTVNLKDTKFHSSWDWLMPVVEKIENTKAKESFYFDVDILSTGVIISSVANHVVQITQEEIQSTSKIEAVYNAVIEFIKWYNENK